MCHTVAMAATAHTDSATPASPIARPTPRPRGDWAAWGSEPARLPAAAKAVVATLLPGKAHPVPRRRVPELTPSLISDADLGALADVVGAHHASRADAVRLLHLG